jgi:hypothetical protein
MHMKPRPVTLALAISVLLLGVRNAEAQSPPPEGQPCAAEPTNQLLAYGDHVNPCSIGQLGDSDLFRFNGVSGELVSVRVTDLAGDNSVPSCVLELLRPVGTPVTAIGAGGMCEIRITLDATGLFTARVSESGNDHLMNYALEIDRHLPISGSASSINPGDTLIGRRIDPLGDADLYLFNGVNGDVISLRGTDQAGTNSVPSIVLELFRPDGTWAVPPVGAGGTAIIETTLDQTGPFTIRVTEAGNDHPMTYNLEYQCLVGSCPSFHTLTVDRTSGGTVTSTPAGITCGTDCFERYFSGTVVTLTATPDPLWNFAGWTGNDCLDGVVTVTAAMTCRATFIPEQVDVAVDFGPQYGLWLLGAGSTWQHLHAASPKALATGDFDGNATDDLMVDFGDGLGVYVWMNHTSWQFVHTLSPAHMVAGNLNNDASDEVVFNFSGFGLWIWKHGIGWTPLHGADARVLATGNLDGVLGDELIVDFVDFGIYVYVNNSSWSFLHGLHASKIVAADLDGSGQDDLVVDFPGFGLWRYLNNTAWLPLHHLNSDQLVAGHVDGGGQADLVIAFGSSGVWTFRNNATWVALHGLPAEDIELVDRDGSGIDEVLIDFGPTYGLWQYANNSTWSHVHHLSPEIMAHGRFH